MQTRLLIALAAVLTTCASGQATAAKLVDFLTYRSGDRPKPLAFYGIGGCGVQGGQEDLRAVRELISLGPDAIPEIDKALDSIERTGYKSGYAYNVHWLLYAYARIRGAAAVPRLLQVARNPNLQGGLDNSVAAAVAVALDLTSFIHSTQVPARVISCRGPQPREALNLLILAWERKDERWFKASLGPVASRAFADLLKEPDGTKLREQFRQDAATNETGVGYRFIIPNPWSVPDLALEALPQPFDSLNIEAQFKTRSGRDCGSTRVKFKRARPSAPAYLDYVVDDPGLDGIVRIVAACAAAD